VKTRIVCASISSDVNSERKRARPASPIALAAKGDSKSLSIAPLSSAVEVSPTRMPVTPSTTRSGIPPVLVAITGRLRSIASRITYGRPSPPSRLSEGITRAMDSSMCRRTASLGSLPKRCTLSCRLRLLICSSSLALSGPSPIIVSSVSGTWVTTRANDSTRNP